MDPRGRYPLGEGCACVSSHTPSAYVPNRHHVIPLSWGGPDVPENTVMLCPNSHSSVHRLLNEYIRSGGLPSWEVRREFNAYVRGLAATAWANRPENPTYTVDFAEF